MFCCFFSFFTQKVLVVSKKVVSLQSDLRGGGEERGRWNGSVVQLVRIHACHAWGREFESRPDRQQKRKEVSILSKPLLFLCFSSCKKYDYLLLVAV